MTEKIDKFLKSLDTKLRKRLKQRLIELKRAPFKGSDIKILKSYAGKVYRLRLGKIRIIYQISNNNVEIIDIDYRGNIY